MKRVVGNLKVLKNGCLSGFFALEINWNQRGEAPLFS